MSRPDPDAPGAGAEEVYSPGPFYKTISSLSSSLRCHFLYPASSLTQRSPCPNNARFSVAGAREFCLPSASGRVISIHLIHLNRLLPQLWSVACLSPPRYGPHSDALTCRFYSATRSTLGTFPYHLTTTCPLIAHATVPAVKHASRGTGPPHANTPTVPCSRSKRKAVQSPNANTAASSAELSKSMSNVYVNPRTTERGCPPRQRKVICPTTVR